MENEELNREQEGGLSPPDENTPEESSPCPRSGLIAVQVFFKTGTASQPGDDLLPPERCGERDLRSKQNFQPMDRQLAAADEIADQMTNRMDRPVNPMLPAQIKKDVKEFAKDPLPA